MKGLIVIMKKFQDCNIFVKLYRRAKYQPFYFLLAIWTVIIAFFSKKRKEPLYYYFTIIYGQWFVKAHWYYTIEEVSENLEKIIKKPKKGVNKKVKRKFI